MSACVHKWAPAWGQGSEWGQLRSSCPPDAIGNTKTHLHAHPTAKPTELLCLTCNGFHSRNRSPQLSEAQGKVPPTCRRRLQSCGREAAKM